MPRAGLGRHQFWDPKNEQYKLHVPLIGRALFAVARTLGLSQPRSWRQWMHFDQGQTPECTAFGSATFLAADPTHKAVAWLRTLDIHQWYRDNQAEDRAQGRVFSEGATTLAAMEVGKRRGYWDKYDWALSFDDVIAHLHNVGPIIAGINWYSTMFDRDAEGIIRIGPRASLEGGHLCTIGADHPRWTAADLARRGLVAIRQTWGDGDYLLPVDNLARLHTEDGEFVYPNKQKAA